MRTRDFKLLVAAVSIVCAGLSLANAEEPTPSPGAREPAEAPSLAPAIESTGQYSPAGAEIVRVTVPAPDGLGEPVTHYGILRVDGSVDWFNYVKSAYASRPGNDIAPIVRGRSVVPVTSVTSPPGGSSEVNSPSRPLNVKPRPYVKSDSAPLPTNRVDGIGRPVYEKFVHAPTAENPERGALVPGIIGNKRLLRPHQFTPFRPAWDPQKMGLPMDKLPPSVVQDVTTPIPDHRAMVPAGPLSPEQLQHLFSKKDFWRPSLLQKSIETVGNGFKATYKTMTDPAFHEQLKAAYTKGDQWGANTGAGFATYYVAMGMTAAVECLQANASNPVACEDYLHSLTDPVGLAMAGGFMLVANPFLSKVGNFSTATGTLRGLPNFSAGILLGVGFSGLAQYGMNPDVRKCLGLNYKHLGHRDLEACDRAYTLFTGENLGNTWMPMMANILASIVIFMPAQYIWTASGGAAAIQRLPLIGGGARGAFMASVITTIIFYEAYNLSNVGLHIQKWVLERNVIKGGWSTNYYGAGTEQNEAYLYSGWARLKANGFVDVKPPEDQRVNNTPECQTDYDTQLRAMAVSGSLAPPPLPQSCVLPDSARDFVGVLNRYGELQSNFRNLQLGEITDAGKAWMKKVMAYHTTMNTTYIYYKQLIEAIERERANPGMTDDDPNGFNPMVVGKMQKALDQVIEATKESPVPYEVQETKNVFNKVDTHKFLDFIVASMACGPEAEGYYVTEPNDLTRKAQRLLTDYVSNDFNPHDRLISNARGMKARFFPPRIVQRIPGSDDAVCNHAAFPIPALSGLLQGGSLGPTPAKFMVVPGLFRRGPQYRNLYKFIIANARDGVLGDGVANFDKWWKENLSPAIEATEAQFREEYSELLRKLYLPAIVKEDYAYCDVSRNMDPSLTGVFKSLALSRYGHCNTNAGHRLAYGVWNSVHEQLRTYLALFIDMDKTLAASKGQDPAAMEQTLQPMAGNILNLYDEQVTSMILTDRFHFRAAADQADMDQVFQAFVVFMHQVQTLHPDLVSMPDCAHPYDISSAANLTCKIMESLGTANQYLKILQMFDVDNDPQKIAADAAANAKAGSK